MELINSCLSKSSMELYLEAISENFSENLSKVENSLLGDRVLSDDEKWDMITQAIDSPICCVQHIKDIIKSLKDIDPVLAISLGFVDQLKSHLSYLSRSSS